ncbi:hypothetical protein HF086_009531 [Spodoptera exigua]|uniref:C2H2-type domain-containing protein n=1 Tax=Spodoptera exigua TaxID=7107 RepID=A0A922SEY0_SPOEX|nr:hypothetical protein HF086_009531 [Spodoptera exigua]
MSEEKIEVETFFGRCRCCLAYGYLKNMWLEHKYNGNSEIYGEMLAKCFALTVKNEITIKEERLDEKFLAEHPDDDEDNVSHTETEYISFNNDTMESIKEEAPDVEYTDVEYLEDEVANITAVDSSQTYNPQPIQRKKRPRVFDTEEDESGKPKRKWPQKLPKSERHKTYKQYSEMDLRKCLEEVRSGALTPGDAAVQYNIPKKTICAKVKMNTTDVPIDNTTKSKLGRREKRLKKKPTIFKPSALDEKTIKQIENKKLKVKERKKSVEQKEISIKKIKANNDFKEKVEIILDPIKKLDQVDAEQVRTRFKAIVNEKLKKGNKERQNQETSEMNKHKHNLKNILDHSNATVIKGFWTRGYHCGFCKEHRQTASDLKKHNLEAHNLIDDVITVKYVSDLFIRLDITDLKCRICNAKLKNIEDLTEHLSKTHDIKFHTDIKNYIVPFVLDSESLKCATDLMNVSKKLKKKLLFVDVQWNDTAKGENKQKSKIIVQKFKENVRILIKCTNATPIKGHWGIGYACLHCPYQTPDPPELKKHTLTTHFSNSEPIENVRYVSDMVLRVDVTDLKCEICDLRMDSLKDAMIHLKNNHDQPIHLDIPDHIIPFKFDNDFLQCALCSKQFDYFKHLSEHMTEHYPNYECADCGKHFINTRALRTHVIRHQKGVFVCAFCSKIFDTRIRMKEHERVLHMKGSKTRKCGYCDEKFMDTVRKNDHEVKVHGAPIPQFSCKACGKNFDSQRSLKSHINHFHLLLRPHKCPECGKGFYNKNEMKRHTVKHTKLKEYQCQICSKYYVTRSSLKSHMKIHDNQELFTCERCGDTFIQKKAWIQHVTKHADEAKSDMDAVDNASQDSIFA